VHNAAAELLRQQREAYELEQAALLARRQGQGQA
jgi:hypothetical protein